MVTLGIHDPRSLGIGRYVARLADAVGDSYVAAGAPRGGARLHFHLGNSSRSVVRQAALVRRPYLLTVHDVIPRAPALMPLYRAAVYPLCVRRAARVVVHSRFAAELLIGTAGVDPGRVVVVAFPASEPPPGIDRERARRELGLDATGPPLFVLPGVIKDAKLGSEAVAAAAPLIRAGRARLLLAGRIADRSSAAAARAAGAQLVEQPSDRDYDLAIAAADCVLVLRAGSVGESNGPLLDAIGAHRAVLATDTGSIREIAAGAAAFAAAPTADAIGGGMRALLDPAARAPLAAAAAALARELTWSASAARHVALLEEVYG